MCPLLGQPGSAPVPGVARGAAASCSMTRQELQQNEGAAAARGGSACDWTVQGLCIQCIKFCNLVPGCSRQTDNLGSAATTHPPSHSSSLSSLPPPAPHPHLSSHLSSLSHPQLFANCLLLTLPPIVPPSGPQPRPSVTPTAPPGDQRARARTDRPHRHFGPPTTTLSSSSPLPSPSPSPPRLFPPPTIAEKVIDTPH